MLRKVIDRPVLATVISIILVILGIVGILRLPITRFPDVSPTTIMVTGSYPGANSEAVLRSVVIPLEEQINGVEDMQYIKSTASNDGAFSISIIFKQGVNADLAAVNVQNRVQQANAVLPQEVIRMGLTTSKQQNSMIMIFNIYTDDNSKYDELFLQNYVNINLLPGIKRVSGVGQTQVFGIKDYSMRVWLDPQKMAGFGLIPDDITSAISNQSLEAAPGKLGEESNAALEYVIRYKGKKNLPEEYENIVVKRNGANLVRLKDVSKIEFGSISYSSDTKVDGKNGVTVAILQTSGSNANDVEIGVRNEIEKASHSFPPGVKFSMVMSSKDRLDKAIGQVLFTLIEAFILVFFVVLLFLKDFRSTLIPAIAVPVAIIGTFFFLLIFGFTINTLTLFALVLAIGIVVDDAIVVVEAVHSKMEVSDLTAKEATHGAMKSITSAIVSITLVMAAVFIPIGFMTGSSGVFYKQFAYTLVVAIIISAINALTLTPALCALLLKNAHCDNRREGKLNFRQRFFNAFDAAFKSIVDKYIYGVKFLISRKWLSAGIVVGLIVIAGILMVNTPKSFVPMEDDNMIMYNLSMPPGTGLDRTREATRKIDSLLNNIQAIDNYSSITGFSLLSNSSGPSYAMGFIKLKDPDQRGEVKDIEDVLRIVSEKLDSVKEGTLMAFRMPPVDGYGATNGVELVLQDKYGKSIESLKAVGDSVVTKIMQQAGVQSVYTMFRTDYPQFQLEVDEEKASQMGVDVSKMLNVIQVYLSGDQSLTFTRFGKFYRVNIKGEAAFRTNASAFNEIFVRNDKNEMIPVTSLVTLHKVYGPESVDRYNLFNAITVNVATTSEVSNGAIMDVLEKKVLKNLPSGYSYEWTGLSLEEKMAGNQTFLILLLCVLFVYFILAAQYESYLLPFAVLLSIPTGLIGAFLGIKAVGFDNNIYVQVGVIMLIGLLAKNAILIIEYAIQRRKSGLSILKSAISGSKARIRPIVMTSLAFIVGLIPLMRATGDMAASNKSISISAALGMLSGILLGVFIIPLLFIAFQHLQEKVSCQNNQISKFQSNEVN